MSPALRLHTRSRRLEIELGVGRVQLIETLADLAARRGTTIIVATHDVDLAERAPHRLAMRDGRVRALAIA